MIIYNGQTGGLGRHFEKALRTLHLPFMQQTSRLENQKGFKDELSELVVRENHVTLVQMAALVSVPVCEKDPEHAERVNVTDTMATIKTFTEWAVGHRLTPRVFYVSTGHVYGDSAENRPLSEVTLPSPRSVYAKTKRKAEEELLSFQKNNPKMQVLIGRVFGLVGPNQPAHYVLPSLLRRAKENDFSPVPGLLFVRDYLDARDVCRSIAELCALNWKDAAFPKHHVINVCSGKPVSIREMFLLVLKALGFPAEVEKRLKEAPGRPDDVAYMVGDAQRLTALLKKAPQTISLLQTIADSLD
jgi:nucleoside-diphosphate-sugar epimerase